MSEEEILNIMNKLGNIYDELKKDDEEGHSSAYEMQFEDFEAIQGLLDLYKEKNKQIQVEIEGRNILVGLNENLKEELKKEKEKNKELLENATVTYFNDEELKESVGNYLGVLLKKNIEKDYISKNKIREIIYPTPTNPISYEIQTSDMYRKILQLLEEK